MQDFLTQLAQALATNDTQFLFDNLHPAVLKLYGADMCQAHFKQRSPDPSYKVEFISMTGPAPWSWVPAKAPIPVEDVYTVKATVTAQNKVTTAELHVGLVGDGLYWFTQC
jgi:hypothetical protein